MDRRLRIVDFSTHLSGPVASALLRDVGADVIKIENPRNGDGLRGLKPTIAGTGHYHVGLNSGARSLAITHTSPQWDRVVAACATWADAVIVGLTQRTARKLRIDYPRLRAIAPRLNYVAITGYGDRGPWRDVPAHGLNVEARTGRVPIEWHDGLPEVSPSYQSTGTTAAGVMAAIGVLGAIARQGPSDEGEYVEVSLWASAMWWNWRNLNLVVNTGQQKPDYSTLGPRYALYPTADDRVLLVCPIEQKFWLRFCDVLGLPESWKSRGSWEGTGVDYGYPEEREAIAAITRTRTLSDWLGKLSDASIPCSPLLSEREAIESEHAAAEQTLRTVQVAGQQARIVRPPFNFGPGERTPSAAPAPVTPQLGGDEATILRDLGLQ